MFCSLFFFLLFVIMSFVFVLFSSSSSSFLQRQTEELARADRERQRVLRVQMQHLLPDEEGKVREEQNRYIYIYIIFLIYHTIHISIHND